MELRVSWEIHTHSRKHATNTPKKDGPKIKINQDCCHHDHTDKPSGMVQSLVGGSLQYSREEGNAKERRGERDGKRCTAGRDLSGGGDSSDKLIAHHRIWILRPATQSSTDISSFVADHDSHAQTPAKRSSAGRKLGGSRESIVLLARPPPEGALRSRSPPVFFAHSHSMRTPSAAVSR